MRKINSSFLLMMLVVFSGAIKAQTILSESFEGTFPPTGWALVNASTQTPPGSPWAQNTASLYAVSGTKSMFYAYESTGVSDANAWAFSAPLNVTTGTTYRVSYWYRARSATFPESFKTTIGNAQTVAAATTVLATHSGINSTVFAESVVNYTATSTGALYLGFHCFSPADQWNLYVDSVVVQQLSGCNGTPAPGTISGPTAACTGTPFILTNTGATSGGGLKYAWQKSTDNMTWTNLNNTSAITSPYSVTQTVSTYYRMVDTCSTSGLSAISNVIQITMNSVTNCYCASASTDPLDEDIFNVTVGTLNNSSTCTTTGGTGSVLNKYSNYTAVAAPNLSRTSSIPLSIQIGTCTPSGSWTNYSAIYIDYNQNGSFTDAGEQVYLTPAINNGAHTETGSFIVPATALLGNTRMRVVCNETITPANNTPCGTYSWGETEDYTVNITTAPTCTAVTGTNIVARNAAFMQLEWNASTGSTGYEYVIDNSPSDPSGAGTPESGNSNVFAFGTFDDTKIYWVHVRSNCGANGFSAWSKAISIPCVTNIAPANVATNVSITPTFNWGLVAGATSYGVYLSSDGGSTYPRLGTIAAPPVTITGLNYSTTYYWYIKAINGSDSSATACSTTNNTSFTTIAPPPPPPNDGCANAVNLTIGAGFCATPVLGTLSSADSTSGLGAASCASTALKYDVWYKATIPATGNLTVQTSAVNTFVTDLVLQAYSGTCGTLTGIGCNDDGNPDLAPSAAHSKLGLTGRMPGEVIYYRVMSYDAASIGAFAICAFDTTASVMPAIATGTPNSCTNASAAIVLDSAWKFTYATFKDASGRIMGQLWPNGSVMGSTTMSIYNNSGTVRKDVNNLYYLDRNMTVTPTIQPIGQVITRMYFTDVELTALGGVTGGATRSQLNGSKTQQTCATSAISADATIINQYSSGAYGTNHFVEVAPNAFSTFYFHKGNVALPVNYAELTGTRNGSKVDLSWVTKTETNNRMFEIQRSADGRSFGTVGSIATKAVGGNSILPIAYNFTDVLPLATTNYYRLKQTDIDGKVTYSNIVLVKGLKPSLFSLNSIFPNPARERVSATFQSPFADNITLLITDMAGKIIKRQVANMAIGDNVVTVDVAALSAGSYLLKAICKDGCETAVKKFTKQ